MRRPSFVVMAMLVSVIACGTAALAGAQVTYRPTMVTLSRRVGYELASAYTPDRERLWCVTAWETREEPEYTSILITDVSEEPKHASDRHMTLTGNECRHGEFARWPIIHSHPIGNCQASPADLRTAVQRAAPFDGILCGDRFATWYFFKEITDVVWARTVAEVEAH